MDGDALTITGNSNPSAHGGSVVLSGSNFVYTPPPDFTGADTFDYILRDGHGGVATGTVTVQVQMAMVYLPLVSR